MAVHYRQTLSFKILKILSIVLVSLVLFCFISVAFLTLYLTATEFKRKSSGIVVVIGTLVLNKCLLLSATQSLLNCSSDPDFADSVRSEGTVRGEAKVDHILHFDLHFSAVLLFDYFS